LFSIGQESSEVQAYAHGPSQICTTFTTVRGLDIIGRPSRENTVFRGEAHA
jgi:hypothetical protein